MPTDTITTMLMFSGRAEEAMAFYTGIFDDSGVDFIQHYGPENPGSEGKVVHGRFRISGEPMMAMDNGAETQHVFTPAMSFFVTCPSAEEVDRLFAALSDGGSVMMGLDTYPFAKRYAWIQDRFGVSWQLAFN